MLRNVKGVVLDLDGCLYIGEKPVEGAGDAVRRLREMGVAIAFLTNNSTLTRKKYVEKLAKMGIEAYVEEVLTSGVVAAKFIKRRNAGDKILPVAEEGFTQEAADLGLKILDPEDWREADYVVVGLDRRLSYDKLAKASMAIRNGAFYLATNLDHVYPTEDGFLPGAGAIASFLTKATGVEPLSVGKPSEECARQVLELLNIPKDMVLFVGDRVDTDVAIAKAIGCRSILVKTGAYRLFKDHPIQADLVVETIAEVPDHISVP